MPVNKDPKPEDVQPSNEPQQITREAPSTEPVKQDRPEPKEDPNAVPQSYVWLADGSVLRVNNEDLPGASGAANAHGHWQRGNKVYEIVGIHPVEDVVEVEK